MSDAFYTIVNGAAGGGRGRKRALSVLSDLRRRGVELEVRYTDHAGHATELAREAYAGGRRRFLACGGDGTSYEVVNGLFADGAPEDVVFGSVPLGTGNSFLRDFDISDQHAAVSAVARGDVRPLDVIRAKHSEGEIHYINLLSVGFTAQAGGLTNRRFKRFGTLGYVMAVLVSVAKLESPVEPIDVDEGDGETKRVELPSTFISFSNSRFTGGLMMMAPEADTSDGLLDVVHISDIGRVGLVKEFPKIFKGTHIENPDATCLKARKVAFTQPRPQEVMVDGEVLTLTLEELEVLPGALSLVA